VSGGRHLRQPTADGPLPGDAGWLALPDDEIVFRIESLGTHHDHDEDHDMPDAEIRQHARTPSRTLETKWKTGPL